MADNVVHLAERRHSGMDVQGWLDTVAYPALWERLPELHPGFGWTLGADRYTATTWPDDFPVQCHEHRVDRLEVYRNNWGRIIVHGSSAEHISFLELEVNGQPATEGRFHVAIRALASRLGIPPPDTAELSEAQKTEIHAKEERRAALHVAIEHCQENIWSGAGGKAREYLHGRGFNDDEIEDLQLGLYTSEEDLADALAAGGRDVTMARASGVLWGKMAGRIVMPWYDAYGQPQTLYGRLLELPEEDVGEDERTSEREVNPDGDGSDCPAAQPESGVEGDAAARKPRSEKGGAPKEAEKAPKYLALWGKQTKDSPLFFDRARQAGHDEIVPVEGVLDAGKAQARGDTRVVGYIGKSLTEAHVNVMLRHGVKTVILCGDADSGGDDGTKASIKVLRKAGVTALVVPRLPEKDPDVYIEKHGIDAWKKRVSEAVPATEYLVDRALGNVSKDSPNAQRLKAIRAALGQEFPDDVEREMAVEHIAKRTGLPKATVAKTAKQTERRASDGRKVGPGQVASGTLAIPEPHERRPTPMRDAVPGLPEEVLPSAQVPKTHTYQKREIHRIVDKKLPTGGIAMSLVRVCPKPFVPVAIIDTDDGAQHIRFIYESVSGGGFRISVAPKERLASAKEIIKLARIGVEVTSNSAAELVDYNEAYLNLNSPYLAKFRGHAQCGFKNDNVFLLGHTVIGSDDADRPAVLVPPETDPAGAKTIEAIRTGGDESEQTLALRKVIEMSEGAAVALAVGLAGPVVARFGLPVPCAYLGATGGQGKSSILIAAGSLTGWTGEPSSRTPTGVCRLATGTPNGLLVSAKITNHTTFIADEFKGPTNANEARRWATAFQSLADGTPRAVSRRDGGGLRYSETWACPLLLAGEARLSDIGETDGLRRRFLPIDAPYCRHPPDLGRAVVPLRTHFGYPTRRIVEALVQCSDEQAASWRNRWSQHFDSLPLPDNALFATWAGSIASLLTVVDFAEECGLDLDAATWRQHLYDYWESLLEAHRDEQHLDTKDVPTRAFEYVKGELAKRQSEIMNSNGDLPERGIVIAGHEVVPKISKHILRTAVIGIVLRSVLAQGGFSTDVLRTWRDRGWLIVDVQASKRSLTVRRRFGGARPTCYLLALEDDDPSRQAHEEHSG